MLGQPIMKALLVIAFLWNGFPTVEYVYVPDMGECRSLGWFLLNELASDVTLRCEVLDPESMLTLESTADKLT